MVGIEIDGIMIISSRIRADTIDEVIAEMTIEDICLLSTDVQSE